MVQMLLGLGMENVWAKTAENEDEPKQLYAQSAVLMDADQWAYFYLEKRQR